MSNVINLKEYKDKNVFNEEKYRIYLQSLHKIDLLDEMVKLNTEIEKDGWTKNHCKKGLVLYNELLVTSQTEDMINLCKKML